MECNQDISGPLWSAALLDRGPNVILETHAAFLRAGADIISTSTYQCAFSTFERAGYSPDDAKRLMRQAVYLANEAKERFVKLDDVSVSKRDIKIALSLGPFGATLSPTQEFQGYYPPPYGPRGFTSLDSLSDKGNDSYEYPHRFADERDEERAIEALADFHHTRLRVFAEDKDLWALIDHIAFETVPLLREIKAIRQAMGKLYTDFAEEEARKDWWISTVHLYPHGHIPENEGSVTTKEVVNATLGEEMYKLYTENKIIIRPAPIPTAIGVNCTEVELIPRIVEEMHLLVAQGQYEAPWLAIYPNGGYVKPAATEDGRSWAFQLGEIVRSEVLRGFWAGIVVGGCCKTTTQNIRELVGLIRPSVC